MTAADFLEWRKRLGLTVRAAASALGIHQETVSQYGSGKSPVPLAIELACEAIEARASEQTGETSMNAVTLTDAERDTIIAALRAWQCNLSFIAAISTLPKKHADAVVLERAKTIDSLCQKLKRP